VPGPDNSLMVTGISSLLVTGRSWKASYSLGCCTLAQTGLLAASGGFAGVEEHAPESLVMRDEAEGPWYSHKQGYLLQAVVLLVWRNMLPTAW
jgi:hypothetical protein